MIYEGGVQVFTGDDISVVDHLRFECQKCHEFKPKKRPMILFSGILVGEIEIKCHQCNQMNRFQGVETSVIAPV